VPIEVAPVGAEKGELALGGENEKRCGAKRDQRDSPG
jgi:hypothetical protein